MARNHSLHFWSKLAALALVTSGCTTQLLGEGSASESYQPQIRTANAKQPLTSSGPLLYISNGGSGEVLMLSYPHGDLVGSFSLPDGQLPSGLCGTPDGNVYVTAQEDIYVYAHGGDTPIETVADPYGGQLLACSVDPTTGNLAVVDTLTEAYGVQVYTNLSGKPEQYLVSGINVLVACAYDGVGDLFVDGYNQPKAKHQAKVAELASGSSSFQDVYVPKISRPGAMQWMGNYMAISDSGSPIYRVNFSSEKATILGKTRATGTRRQWWIEGSTLIAPYNKHTHANYGNEVAFYRYPKGGAPTTLLDNFGADPLIGSVLVSK